MKTKSGSNFIRETCIAGATIGVVIKYSFKAGGKKRGARTNPTREAVMKYNDRLAARKLTMLLNANFNPGDWHATFTYAGDPPTQKEAKREIKNFKQRMTREYAKQGRDFHWIEVTEYKNHRIHHHMVMSYIDSKIIERQWKNGHVRFTALDRSRNYRKLAEYLLKETTRTMREPGNETNKRWSASRNLVRPVIKREVVSAKALFEQPRPLKGYEIDPDTVHRYEHPFTGIEHLEYLMLSTDPVPRLKTWRHGKIVDRNETYKRATQIQVDMESLDGWYFV